MATKGRYTEGQGGSKCHPMLFGNPYVVKPVRKKRFENRSRACTEAHGSSNCYDLFIIRCELYNCVAKNVSIRACTGSFAFPVVTSKVEIP